MQDTERLTHALPLERREGLVCGGVATTCLVDLAAGIEKTETLVDVIDLMAPRREGRTAEPARNRKVASATRPTRPLPSHTG